MRPLLPSGSCRGPQSQVTPRALLTVTGNVLANYPFWEECTGLPQPGHATSRRRFPPASRGLCYSTATRACAGAMQDVCRRHGDLLPAIKTRTGSRSEMVRLRLCSHSQSENSAGHTTPRVVVGNWRQCGCCRSLLPSRIRRSSVSGRGGEYSGPRPPHGAYAATISNGLCDHTRAMPRPVANIVRVGVCVTLRKDLTTFGRTAATNSFTRSRPETSESPQRI